MSEDLPLAALRDAPITGSRLTLWGDLKDFWAQPLHAVQRMWLEHGDLVRMRFGPRSAFLVSGADFARHILATNHRNYRRQPFSNEIIKQLVQSNVFTSDGDFQVRQRRFLQPAFHSTRVSQAMARVVGLTDEMLDRWERSLADGRSLDMQREIVDLTLQIICRTILGVDVLDDARTLRADFDLVVDWVTRRLNQPIAPPLSIPTRSNRAFRRSRARLTQAIGDVLSRHRDGASQAGDLVDVWLSGRYADTGESISDAQLVREIITLILMTTTTIMTTMNTVVPATQCCNGWDISSRRMRMVTKRPHWIPISPPIKVFGR